MHIYAREISTFVTYNNNKIKVSGVTGVGGRGYIPSDGRGTGMREGVHP